MTHNLETVQRLYDAFAKRDTQRIREIFAPDIEWIQNEGFPNGGRHRGTDAVVNDVFGVFRKEWKEFKSVVAQWIESGDTVIALGEYRGRHLSTGKQAIAAFAHVYDLRDGRIIRFRQYTDTAMIAAAMHDD